MSGLHDLLHDLREDEDARAQLAALVAPTRTVHTVATLARELEVSDRTIRRAIEAGELPASRRAGRWVMTVDDVRDWVARGRRATRVPHQDRPQPRRRTMASALELP